MLAVECFKVFSGVDPAAKRCQNAGQSKVKLWLIGRYVFFFFDMHYVAFNMKNYLVTELVARYPPNLIIMSVNQ